MAFDTACFGRAIEGQGKRQHGKEKLRIDEARAWSLVALRLAHEDEPGAVAALVSLLMGMRSSEIVWRKCGTWTTRSPALDRAEQDESGQAQAGGAERPSAVPARAGGGQGRICPSVPELSEGVGPRLVRRTCELAAVPMVCAHAMRGLQTDLALEAGATAELAAKALGHEHVSTTEQSYASASSSTASKSKRALRVLLGGAN